MLLFGTITNPFSTEYISEEHLHIKKLFSKKPNTHLLELLQYLNSNDKSKWKLDEVIAIDNTCSSDTKITDQNKENVFLNYKIFISEVGKIETVHIDTLWNLKTLLMLNYEIEVKQKKSNYKILDQLAQQILGDLEVSTGEIELADRLCEILEINKTEFASLMQAKAEPTINSFISSKTFDKLEQLDIEKIKNYYAYLNSKEYKYDIEIPLKFLNEYNEYCYTVGKGVVGLNLNVGFPSHIIFPLYGAYNCSVGKKKKVQGQSSYEQNPARVYNYGAALIVANKYSYVDSFNGVNIVFMTDEIKEIGESSFSNTGETFLYILKKGERNPYGFSGFENDKHRDLLSKFIKHFKDPPKVEVETKTKVAIIPKQREEKSKAPDTVSNTKKESEDYLLELKNLVGIETVKEQINSLINFIKMQNLRKEKNLKTAAINLHSVFIGSPGTGKTTVARLYGGILNQLGILKKGHMVEVDRSGLVAGYLGQTALKVDEVINKALDGILFIDEAYSLTSSESDSYGGEAVDILLKRMEDNRDRLVVILAGYKDEMDQFINSNPGLQSRFNRYISFNNYSADELLAIFKLLCKQNEYQINDQAENYLKEYFCETLKTEIKNFGNGRYVRNIFEKIIQCHSNRVIKVDSPTEEQMITFSIEDIKEAI